MITSNHQQLVLLATTYSPTCTYEVDKNLYGYYTIQYMESGGVYLAYDDDEYLLEGSWFWPAYPGPRTHFHKAQGYDYWFHRHIGFQGPLVERWIEAGLWPWKPQPAPLTHNYSAFFDEMIQLVLRTDTCGWLRTVNMLEQLLIELAEARTNTAVDDPWVEEVKNTLLKDGQFVPDYDGLAKRFQMGLSTLRRRFRQSTGISLHQWIMQMRISEAKTLLTDTDLPIVRIASILQYENVYFFSRQFKETCGVSPSEYRNSRLRSFVPNDSPQTID